MNKKRILIIDDEPGITTMVKLVLQQTGEYEVREENRSIEGLNAAREFKPDLVILDVMMPDLDGGDVAAQLKEDRQLKGTPIVYLTAALLPGEAEANGGMIGGHPAIPKPVSEEVLIDVIQKCLG